MTIESITQDYVKQLFDYRDGNLYWKINKGRARIGLKAGSLNNSGYFLVKINNKLQGLHRIIFLLHYGFIPDQVDHIDNNPLNNKIENLRPATKSENQQNVQLKKNNLSGVKNVYWYKNRNKWVVAVQVNGKRTNFGYFDDLELAELVAQEARTKYHGAFANHG